MRRCRAASVLIVLLAFPLYAQAAPEPIVFDFKDGLQGWELYGAATRVQTQVLGGGWAILGDGVVQGNTAISTEIDLMGISSITVDFFFVGPQFTGLEFFTLWIDKRPTARGLLATLRPQNDPTANPESLSFSVPASVTSQEFPDRRLRISWTTFENVSYCGPGPGCPVTNPWRGAVGFIDNITFHPVPEPSSWLLLGLGIAGAAMTRRKLVSPTWSPRRLKRVRTVGAHGSKWW